MGSTFNRQHQGGIKQSLRAVKVGSGKVCQACKMQIYFLVKLHSFVFTKAHKFGGRVGVVIGGRNPSPKTQGRLASEKSSREK